MSDLSFEEDGPVGHAHPSVMFYNGIAVSLFVVTALEVAILFPPLDDMGTYFKVILLILLSLGKFAIVVAFFMHLFFDAPLCTFLFTIGMVIAIGTVVVLINVMPQAEHPLTPLEKPKNVTMPGEHAFMERLEQWRKVKLG